MTEELRHSKLGKASLTLAIGLAPLAGLLVALGAGLDEYGGSAGIRIANTLLGATFAVVGPGGHLVGILLGVGAIFKRDRKRGLALVGTGLNLLLFLLSLLVVAFLFLTPSISV